MTSEKQKRYAQARGRGLSRDQSAIMAGVDNSRKSGNLNELEHSKGVQTELARIRAETAKNTQITKEDVAEMLVEAANMAREMADPQGLVAAARELGKLLGYYAPEVKKITHNLDKEQLLRVMEEMSDEELLKHKNGKIIDVKPERIANSPEQERD
jgi:hypothetical protein